MKTLILFMIGLHLLIGCQPEVDYEAAVYKGEYIESEKPDGYPILFAENAITTKFNERDMAISPDGTEIYFTMVGPSYSTIVYTKMVGNAWTPVRTAPFSGKYNDIEASFSPDGSRLYFASKRPRDSTTDQKDYDIWYVDRISNG